MRVLVCESCGNLETDTPFFYSTVCSDTAVGVLADTYGNPVSRFIDGTTGVSQKTLDNLESHGYDCLHCVKCGETPGFEELL